MAGATLSKRDFVSHVVFMKDTEERKQRLEAAISEALQREATRHEAILKNMHRLRSLRLERDQKADTLARLDRYRS
jgi:hypothetical protein